MELVKNIAVLPLLVCLIAFIVFLAKGDLGGMFIFGIATIGLYTFIKD